MLFVKKKKALLQFFSISQIFENYNYGIKFCHSSPILTLREKLYLSEQLIRNC